MNVAFVNENTLGHASYLLPFCNHLREHPELGVTPHLIHATPLPDGLSRRANLSIRGLRKWGLDFHNSRWRMAVSRFVRDQLTPLVEQGALDAVVANTQSVALALANVADRVPVFVCLDATFRQLSASRWFAPNFGSRLFLPVTAGSLLRRERRVLERVQGLFAWSQDVRVSLLDDYGCAPDRIHLLPPSIDLRHRRAERHVHSRPQILFVGGDFTRKGGPLLLECYRRWFSGSCDLHLVTRSPVDPEPGVYVHRDVQPLTRPWFERWHRADAFVFPSTLETFGIALLEALAFQVPAVSADVGAAKFILAGGKAGWLLADRTPEHLRDVLRGALHDREAARQRVAEGRKRVEQLFDLSRNTEKLVKWLKDATVARSTVRIHQTLEEVRNA